MDYEKIQSAGTNVPMKVKRGHFATNHSHINYYIDTTTLKTRAGDAREIARSLASYYLMDVTVDTIVCMEGTEVIGAFLSDEFSRAGVLSTNAHKTIYVVTPEVNASGQLIFRENLVPEIAGKHVLVLMAMITTGQSVNRVMQAIQYYHGTISGVSAIFSAIDAIEGVALRSVFGKNDLPDYAQYEYQACPMCRRGERLDALVNAFGYDAL